MQSRNWLLQAAFSGELPPSWSCIPRGGETGFTRLHDKEKEIMRDFSL